MCIKKKICSLTLFDSNGLQQEKIFISVFNDYKISRNHLDFKILKKFQCTGQESL